MTPTLDLDEGQLRALRGDLLVCLLATAELLRDAVGEYPHMRRALDALNPRAPDAELAGAMASAARERVLQMALCTTTLSRLWPLRTQLGLDHSDTPPGAAVELLGALTETYVLIAGADQRLGRPSELAEIRELALSADRVAYLRDACAGWLDRAHLPADQRARWLTDRLC
jgi:hypothetical protein